MPEKSSYASDESKPIPRATEHLEMRVVEKVPEGEEYKRKKEKKTVKPSAPPPSERGINAKKSILSPVSKKVKKTQISDYVDFNDDYQYNPKDKTSKVHPGDTVLLDGVLCKVLDCCFDEGDEQMLLFSSPEQSRNKMVERRDVLALRQKKKKTVNPTPGDPSRTHLIEEFGEDCPAKIIWSKRKFTNHWLGVYHEEPEVEMMHRLLGQKITINALDLGHGTGRTEIDGDIMWLPRACIVLEAKPVFVLDEERTGGATPGGIPTQPPQRPALNLQPYSIIEKKEEDERTIINVNDAVSEPNQYHHPAPQNHSQMTAPVPNAEMENPEIEGKKYLEETMIEEEELSIRTSSVVIERHIRQILGDAKVKVYGHSKLEEHRWAINGFVGEDAYKLLSGKQGVATAYDEKNDSFQCTLDGISHWMPHEALMVIPNPPKLSENVRTTTERISVREGVEIQVHGEAPATPQSDEVFEEVNDIFEDYGPVEPEAPTKYEQEHTPEAPQFTDILTPPPVAYESLPQEVAPKQAEQVVDEAQDIEERKKAFAIFTTDLGKNKLEKVLRKYQFASDPMNRDQVARFEVELLFHAIICLYLEEVEKQQKKPRAKGTKQFCIELASHLFRHHGEPDSVRVKDVIEWIMSKELLKIYCPNEYTEPKPSQPIQEEAPKNEPEPKKAEPKPVAKVHSSSAPGQTQQPIKQIRGSFHAVVTMSKETLTRTIAEKGLDSFTEDEILFWVGKRVQVKLYNPNNDSYYVHHNGVETWVPNDPAIKCLGVPKFETKPAEIPQPIVIKEEPKEIAPSVPEVVEDAPIQLAQPLSIVFTMNLDRLTTGMKNQNIPTETLNTLLGKKSTSRSTCKRDGKLMYEVNIDGRTVWAHEDCLIVKRNPPQNRSFSQNDRWRTGYGNRGVTTGYKRI